MHEEIDHKGLRWKVGSWVLYAGIFVFLLAIVDAIPEVEGARQAGGIRQFLGVLRWQHHPRVVAFGFAPPLGCALVFMGSMLRNTRVQTRLAVGLPLGFFALILFVGLVLWFPRVSLVFGIGGTINAVGICTTAYFCARHLRAADPWAGLLRGLGYLTFACTAWFTCGLLAMPGGTLNSTFEHDYATIIDLATKIQIGWVIGWTLTSVGFVLDRRTERVRERSSPGLLLPDAMPGAEVGGARAMSAGAE